MLKPAIGRVVWWYVDGDVVTNPHPAIITGIGMDKRLALAIFAPDLHNAMVRDGVAQVGDKRAKSEDVRDNGAWDFTDSDKEFDAMQRQLNELLVKLGETPKKESKEPKEAKDTALVGSSR